MTFETKQTLGNHLLRLPRVYWRTFFAGGGVEHRRPSASVSPRRWLIGCAVVMTLAGGWLRLSFLNHPMRYDESMVYVKYVVLPLPELARRYDQVQNHILHTILEYEAVRLWDDRPAALRLPAFVAGTALIPLSMALAFVVTGRWIPALLSGGLVAFSSILVDYSTNARGYTMVCALSLGMCLCTVALLRNPTRRRMWPTWAVLATLGTFTIPIMLLPVAGLAGVIAVDAMILRRPRRRRVQLTRLGVMLGTWLVSSGLLYLPAFLHTGAERFFGARKAVVHYSGAVVGSYGEMLGKLWSDWTLDAVVPGIILIGIGLVATLAHALRSRSVIWLMPLLMIVIGAAVAQFLPMAPYARAWLYLLPVVLTLACCGLADLPRPLLRHATTGALAVCILAGAYHTGRREFLIAEDPHTLVDAELVVHSLADMPDREFAIVSLPSTYAIRYYTWRSNLPRPTHPTNPGVRSTFLVVNRTQTLTDVLAAKGAELVDYGPPRKFKTLPHSTLYRMDRLPPPDGAGARLVSGAG